MMEWGRERKDQLPVRQRVKHVSLQQRRFVVLLTCGPGQNRALGTMAERGSR